MKYRMIYFIPESDLHVVHSSVAGVLFVGPRSVISYSFFNWHLPFVNPKRANDAIVKRSETENDRSCTKPQLVGHPKQKPSINCHRDEAIVLWHLSTYDFDW